MCIKTIGDKIERYPPTSFQELSEYEWESIVRIKCQTKTGVKNNVNRGTMNKSQRYRLPAICDAVIKDIEDKNPHLRSSKVIDELIWKDCVEAQFPREGISRPMILFLPWPKLVENISLVASNLLELLKEPHDKSDMVELPKRTARLKKYIKHLCNTPMCVPLLSQSKSGQSLSKFIKQSRKICPAGCNPADYNVPDFFPDVWSEYTVSCHPHNHMSESTQRASPLAIMDGLLQGWKEIASARGVQIKEASKNNGSPQTSFIACSGRSEKTSVEQHQQDIAAAQKCNQWRELHAILVKRKVKVSACNGARIKNMIKKDEASKQTIAKTRTKTYLHRRDQEKLFKPDSSKLKDMRKDFKDAAKVKKGMSLKTKEKVSAFGEAVASVKAGSKQITKFDSNSSNRGLKRGNKLIFGNGQSKREISMSGGKKMKLPRSALKSKTIKRKPH